LLQSQNSSRQFWCRPRRFSDSILTTIYLGDEIKNDQIGEHVARMWGRQVHISFGGVIWMTRST
jgi:hypothetical protein